MPDVVAIIQARMGSKRLPGKVLMPMAGVPMLERVIRRVKEAKLVDGIVVATPGTNADIQILDLAHSYDIGYYHFSNGNDDDVLARFAATVRAQEERHPGVRTGKHIGVIVRICGDSPLIRPDLIDDCVQRLRDSLCHYVSYSLPSGEPAIETKRGVYPEAFTARALRFANEHAQIHSSREHVTQVMRNLPEYHPWLVQVDDDGLDCAVDTQEDFDRVEQLIMEREAVPA